LIWVGVAILLIIGLIIALKKLGVI